MTSMIELIRFEKDVAALWESGAIRVPVHLSGGNEKELIKIFEEVELTDYVFSTHRNHYHALLKGVSKEYILQSLMPQLGGNSRGGSMVIIDPERRFYSSAIIGGTCAIALGVAWAIKERKGKEKVWCFIGDCVTETGHFYESLIYAKGFNLPVVFVIEDNNRATCTPNRARMNVDWPSGFNMPCDDDNVRYYRYVPTYPHVGTGKYVAF